MAAHLIDGKTLAQRLIQDCHTAVIQALEQGRRKPCLAVVLVGQNSASQLYVKHKTAACTQIGIETQQFDLPETVTQIELLSLIQTLNEDTQVDAILVQLPLPPHLSVDAVIESIHPDKDVDGFHPYNLGRLAQKRPHLEPCTPKGIVTLLKSTGLDLVGKHAVVLGASNIVGRPAALALLLAGCTVTVCHSKTQHLPELSRQADILIAAVGRAEFVRGDWIKPGACVIDVGIHRNSAGKIVGDVNFEEAVTVAGFITPVPGGVGPMTVASLMQNTVRCWGQGLKSKG